MRSQFFVTNEMWKLGSPNSIFFSLLDLFGKYAVNGTNNEHTYKHIKHNCVC